jgi:hypothetical protein
MHLSLEKCTPGKIAMMPDHESLGWVVKLQFHKILQEEQILGDESELPDLHYLRPFFSVNLAAVTKKVNLRRVFSGDLEIRMSKNGAPFSVCGATLTPVEVSPMVVNDEIGENESALIALAVKFEVSWLHENIDDRGGKVMPEDHLDFILSGIEMGMSVVIRTPENAPKLRLAG